MIRIEIQNVKPVLDLAASEMVLKVHLFVQLLNYLLIVL